MPKKVNNIEKESKHGDICFLNNYKFQLKYPFNVISYVVTVVTLCDIFILDIYDSFRNNRF